MAKARKVMRNLGISFTVKNLSGTKKCSDQAGKDQVSVSQNYAKRDWVGGHGYRGLYGWGIYSLIEKGRPERATSSTL